MLLSGMLCVGAARAEPALPEPELPTTPTIRTVTPPPAEALHPAARPMAPFSEALRPTLTQPAREYPPPDSSLRLPAEGVTGLELETDVVKPSTWEVANNTPARRRNWAERMSIRLGKVFDLLWKPTLIVLLVGVAIGGLILRSWYQRNAWRQRNLEPI